jgi:hypothetical protein
MGWAWLTNAALCAAAGAAAATGLGFGWGGWTTADAAARLAKQSAELAVADSLAPYCVVRSRERSAEKVMAELRVAFIRNRPGIIENAGWATPIGQTEPNTPLANACALAIAATWTSQKPWDDKPSAR